MDNSTPSMSEKLVQYLDGEITGSEKENLDQQLATDKGLEDELGSLKATRDSIKLYGLQQKVSGIHRQMMQELKTPVRKLRPASRVIRYAIAMTAVAVLIVGGIIGYNFYNLSSHKIFSSHFSSYELSTMRDGDTAAISPVEKAYRIKDYKHAVTLHALNTMPSPKEDFLAGMSYTELGNSAKAIAAFKKVIAENEKTAAGLFNDESEYYLALTYIRDRDFDFALELLRKIKDNKGHLYHQKVTGKLIRQVKMLKWR